MKKKELFLVGGLILFGLIFQYFDSGEITFVRGCNAGSKTLKDKDHPHEFRSDFTFPDPLEELVFQNHAGSVEISAAENDFISVEAVKIVYHRDESKVRKYADQVEIRNEIEGNKAVIKTVIHEDDFPYPRVRTHFKIFIPGDTRLSVTNRFGDIRVDKAGTLVAIDGKFGDLEISNISSDISIINRFGRTKISDITGKTELDIKFSDTEAERISSIDCRAGHSTLYITDIQESKAVKIEASHTKIELDHVVTGQIRIKDSHQRIGLNSVSAKDFQLTARHCRIVAKNLNSRSIAIKNSHNSIKLTDITGDALNVLLSHGNLRVSLKSEFKSVFVTNSYSDISLGIPETTDPSISLNTKYGDITNHTGLDLNITKARYLTTFSREGKDSTVNINTSYGDIALTKTE